MLRRTYVALKKTAARKELTLAAEMDVIFIAFCFVCGISIGYTRSSAAGLRILGQTLANISLVILLAGMGVKLGADNQILREIHRIGLQAFLLAASSIIGSILLVKIVVGAFDMTCNGANLDQGNEGTRPAKSTIFRMILSLLFGITLGVYIIPPNWVSSIDTMTNTALAALLFGIGVDIGRKKHRILGVRSFNWQLLVIPCMVAAGSIGGAAIAGYFLGTATNEAAAVGAGFGWYSLSAVLLANAHSVELGTLAFLANVLRELLTIMIIPLVAKYFGKLVAIAPGGATTMDVVLPLIKEAAGDETVVPAFVSGAVLSMLVPILVPLLVRV